MKKLLLMIFIFMLSMSLFACSSTDIETKGYGYGVSYRLVHSHYVGVAEVVIDGNDNVVSIKLDEYYLPYTFAAIEVNDAENLPSDILAVVGSRGTTYYAKYVSINSTIFTGQVLGEEGGQSINYSTPGVDNIESWALTESNAKIYVDSVKAGKVFIANADGTESDYVKANVNAKLGWTKSSTGYWTNPSSYPLGWGGNIKAITDSLIGSKVTANESQITNDDSWVIGDLVTGATLVDFLDYYTVIQQAYQNALTVNL